MHFKLIDLTTDTPAIFSNKRLMVGLQVKHKDGLKVGHLRRNRMQLIFFAGFAKIFILNVEYLLALTRLRNERLDGFY